MPLLRSLTTVAAGLETTAGTLVAASRGLPAASADFHPYVERDSRVDLRGTEDAVLDEVERRGARLRLVQNLDYQTVIPAFQCGLQRVTPSGGAWTHAISWATPPALATATFEVIQSDGEGFSAGHRFGYARPTQLTLDISEGVGSLTSMWEGRIAGALATLTRRAVPNRQFVESRAFSVAIDDAWSDAGDTPAGMVRRASLTVNTGCRPYWGKAQRVYADMTNWERQRPTGTLTLFIDHDRAADTELQHFKDGDLRVVRIEASMGSGNALRRLRVDAVIRYLAQPNLFEAADGQHVLTMSGELRPDAAGNLLRVTVANGLSSW